MEKIYITGCTGEYVNTQFCVEHEIIIGRNPQKCQIVYSPAAQGISGVHCKVYVSGGCLYVMDLNSTNGTFLENGVRLSPNSPTQLQNGQRFYLGSNQNMFGVQIVQDMAPVFQAAPQRAPQIGYPVPVYPSVYTGGTKKRDGISPWVLVIVIFIAGFIITGLGVGLYSEMNKSPLEKTFDAVGSWLDYF